MLLFKINVSFNKNNASFGIDVLKGKQTIRTFPGISDSSDELEKLITLCNSLDIEECHIDDIIEDFLTDFKAY